MRGQRSTPLYYPPNSPKNSRKRHGYNKRNPKKGIESPHLLIQRILKRGADCVVGLQQKKSQKGNWESWLHPPGAGTDSPCCYNKRNPKKGIESQVESDRPLRHHSHQLQQKKSQKGNWETRSPVSTLAGFYTLQQKKSQKGNWELELPQLVDQLLMGRELQQKKSQKGNWELAAALSEALQTQPRLLLQQKKSQKGNWESSVTLIVRVIRFDSCYNKRNPKKGIESGHLDLVWGVSNVNVLQQKKSQKGNWESSTFEMLVPESALILARLQQKKSQKGNWEYDVLECTPPSADVLQQKKSQKGNWETKYMTLTHNRC